MRDARKKFRELLREIFQFNCGDLNFGITGIMTQKQAIIVYFIEKNLTQSLANGLSKVTLMEHGVLAEKMKKMSAKIRARILEIGFLAPVAADTP